jgi:Uncharacterized protein conserved in bacteria (DUF2314)
MKEPESNIRCFCQEHAPKPIDYRGDLHTLIGKEVKKGFPAERARLEHMWVKVIGVAKTDMPGITVLVGTLDNEPAYTDKIKNGDLVIVQREEIEAVL